MAGLANVEGDPGTWEKARQLGKLLEIPTGPYEARVPTADEMNAVLPYIMDRMSRFAADKYFCENAEITFAHILGINVPRFGFPDSSGFNRKSGRNWEGYDREGYDRNGINKEGLNRYGFDRDGYNKEGYNRDGYDRDGFNKQGRDWYGKTREQHAAELVQGWSEEMATAVAAHMVQQGIELVTPEPPKKAVKKAATPKRAAAPKKVTVAKPRGRRLVAAQ